jgi:hypothetical protein
LRKIEASRPRACLAVGREQLYGVHVDALKPSNVTLFDRPHPLSQSQLQIGMYFVSVVRFLRFLSANNF